MIDTFFFDWDGTLNDSAHSSFEAMRKALGILGVPLDAKTYEQIYSPNWYSMFEKLRLPREQWEEADNLWLQHYDYGAAQLLPGGREVLDELARRYHATGIISSGNRERILREIDAFGLAGVFRVMICNEDVVNRKPHPEGLILAMAHINRKPEQCCYVGDSPEDIEMGRRAGMRTIGIRGRFPSSRRLENANPDLLLDSLHEFMEKIT